MMNSELRGRGRRLDAVEPSRRGGAYSSLYPLYPSSGRPCSWLLASRHPAWVSVAFTPPPLLLLEMPWCPSGEVAPLFEKQWIEVRPERKHSSFSTLFSLVGDVVDTVPAAPSLGLSHRQLLRIHVRLQPPTPGLGRRWLCP